MLVETNPYLLAVTAIVSVLHMVFDTLAFKNGTFFVTQLFCFSGVYMFLIRHCSNVVG